MKNKIALVTGGMGGIGTAICQHLSQQGATVITTHHREKMSADAWLQEQAKLGFNFKSYYADVSDFDSCNDLVQNIITDFNRIDILVNNAGITRDTQLYKMDLMQWQEVINTNLNSIFNITRHIINGMIVQNYGRIINISSVNGQKGQFGQSNYAAAKAGLHGFTKSLAQEVAKKGITVNTISPGYVDTCMTSNLSKEIMDKIITQIPVGRLARPEEIARAVGFLAQEDSGFITGANLAINGGQYLS